VRVQRPQEQYFATGEAFDVLAQEVQRRFDQPRDAKSLLLSLQQLPFHGLVHVRNRNTRTLQSNPVAKETRLLVAEASCGPPDWVTRPLWLKPDFEWKDPLRMSSTQMLELI
jgi:hypothetical protein